MSEKKVNMILAEKKIGSQMHRRKFTEQAWNLMGKDKNGWKELPAEAQGKKKIDVVIPEAKNTATVKSDEAPATKKKEETIEELRERLAKMEEAEAAKKDNEEKAEPKEEKSDDTPVGPGPDANGTTAPHSTDGNVTKAIAHIKTLKTKEEIETYTKGDDRNTVKKARDKYIAELEQN